MFTFKKCVICPLLAATALLAGSFAYAAGPEPASEPEIAATLPAAESVFHIDLNTPDNAPEGVFFSGSTVTITAAGTYRITGSLQGQVIADTDGPTELILAGVSLQGEECLSIPTNDPVTITLEENTRNFLLDGASAPDEHAAPVILSQGPLTIGGSGALSLTARANHAIRAMDDLTITGGNLYILAANDGLKARGTLTIADGTVSVHSTGDGLEAEAGRITEGCVHITGGSLTIDSRTRGIDAEHSVHIAGGETTLSSLDDGIRALSFSQTDGTIHITAQGYTAADTTEESYTGDGIDTETFTLSGGYLAITSAGDGIQALTDLTVTDGEVYILSGKGGGSAINHSGGDMFGPPGRSSSRSSSSSSTVSAKGLKSDGSITITGGKVGLSTEDDSIHSGILCTIDGGELYIYSSDDAIHSDDMIVINGGDITVYDCFEGLEGFAVEVHGGNILLYAVNDSVNANGPEGWGGNAVENSVSGYADTYYWHSGGWADYITYSTGGNMGDGIDSNNSVFITGGHLTVSTPGTFMENGIDSGFGYFIISGGEVMSGGASSMQPTPYSNTEQCVALIEAISIPTGTTIYIHDSEGNEIWSHDIACYASCLIVSHPGMVQGNTYTVTYEETTISLDFTSSNSITVNNGSRRSGRR